MSSQRADPKTTPDGIAAAYDAAREALHSGDLERMLTLLDQIAVPTTGPDDAHRDGWTAVQDAHRRLRDALAADLGSAQRELADLRRGQRTLRRMAGH